MDIKWVVLGFSTKTAVAGRKIRARNNFIKSDERLHNVRMWVKSDKWGIAFLWGTVTFGSRFTINVVGPVSLFRPTHSIRMEEGYDDVFAFPLNIGESRFRYNGHADRRGIRQYHVKGRVVYTKLSAKP